MHEAPQVTPSAPPYRHREYFPLFDWLRGVLAGVVLIFHQGLFSWPHAGDLAVQVFFALSGWLIGGMLLETSASDLPRFYFNRVARIWAPYFAALSLLLMVSALRDPITKKWLEFAFYKLTFVYNFFGPPQLATHRYEMPLDGTGNHFWTINVEEQFYLIAPILLVVLPRWIGRSLVTWILVCAAAWFVSYNVDVPITSASIALGVTAALIVHQFGEMHLATLSRIALLAIFFGTAFGMAAGFNYRLLSPPFSIAVVLLLAIRGRQNPVAALVGGISYPLYLNHWTGAIVVHAAMKALGLSETPYSLALAIAVGIGIATCMYFAIDRPILKRRSQLFSPKRARLAMLAAYGTLLIGLLIGAWVYQAGQD
jgi:peptidoglycan/LPS O-acetylase OafA/YrhL